MSDEITRVRPARNSTEGGLGRSSPRLTTRTAHQPRDEQPVRRVGDPLLRERFTELMAIKESISTVARSVAIAEERMEAIRMKLDDLEAVVEGLRASPVDTPGTEEDRLTLIHLYGELRRSVDALARSEDPGAWMILGRKTAEEPEQWIFPLGTRGIWGRITRHLLHAGSPGLGIPLVGLLASPENLEAAARALQEARRELAEKQAILRADAQTVFGTLADGGLETVCGGGVRRTIPPSEVPAVEDLGEVVRRLLSTIRDGILHDAGPLLSRSMV